MKVTVLIAQALPVSNIPDKLNIPPPNAHAYRADPTRGSEMRNVDIANVTINKSQLQPPEKLPRDNEPAKFAYYI